MARCRYILSVIILATFHTRTRTKYPCPYHRRVHSQRSVTRQMDIASLQASKGDGRPGACLENLAATVLGLRRRHPVRTEKNGYLVSLLVIGLAEAPRFS